MFIPPVYLFTSRFVNRFGDDVSPFSLISFRLFRFINISLCEAKGSIFKSREIGSRFLDNWISIRGFAVYQKQTVNKIFPRNPGHDDFFFFLILKILFRFVNYIKF